MRNQWRGLTFVAVVFALAGVMAIPAHATLTVDFGGTICADGAACDSNGTVGVENGFVTVTSIVLGTVTVNSSGSSSGSPNGWLSVTLNATPSATGSFEVKVSDTDFTTPPVPLTLSQTVGGTAATTGPTANLSAVGWFGDSNTLWETDTPTSTASTTIGAAQGSGTSPVIYNGTPYSLTSIITIDVTALATGGNPTFQVNADLTAVAVPEPASVALFGGVLLLTVGAIRRRMATRR